MDSLYEIAQSKGIWAAFGVMALALWRAFAIGQRVGRVETTQAEHGKKLDYMIGRLDAHIDKDVNPDG